MADGLTTPRKLEQINWRNGITDGDIRPGFFSELLNVEMDEPARLRTRDGLIAEAVSVPTEEPCKFLHINSDPSSLHSNGWNLFISRYTAFIYPYGEDINHTDAAEIAMPYEIDLDTIDTVILGANVIISSCDPTTGLPNSVISIVWNPSTSKFSPPSYIQSGDGVYGQVAVSGGWGVIAYNRTPELFIQSTDHTSFENKYHRRLALSRLENNLSTNVENGVGLYVTPRLKDTVSTEGTGYTDRAVVRFVAVFVYADGSLSLPSNEKTYTVDFGDPDAGFDICVSPMVHKDCFKSIVGVRIYRKIVEGVANPSPNFDFLMYAPLFDEDIHEDTFKVPALGDGNRDLIKTPSSADFLTEEACENYTYNENENIAGFMQTEWQTYEYWYWEQDNDFFDERIGYSHKFSDDVVHLTAGWIKPKSSSDLMMYMPVHYYQDGQMITTIRHFDSNDEGDPNTSGHGTGIIIRVPFTGGNIRITDRINAGADLNDNWRINNFDLIENCAIIGSHLSPYGLVSGNRLNRQVRYRLPNSNFRGNASDPASYDYDLVCYRGMFRMGSTLPALAEVTPEVDHFWFTGPTVTIGTVPSDEQEGFEKTFAAWRDKAKNQNLPSIEEEFGGVDASNISTVKPRHIGAAGGRLFGLNIVEDDEEQPSKMMYTEFGNFAVFRKDNYLDYGVRDDGIGMAVSNLKSYVIAHHSSSTYIFDISGGSDFVWREIGAYKDVGLYNSKLVVTTPFGVFWCDKNHVWFYDGRQPIPITSEIMNTYRSIVPNLERMLYKEDLKQVWLVQGNGEVTYVFDIDGNRWHTHHLTDHNENTRLFDTIYNVGHSVFINIVDRDYLNHDFYKFDRNATEPFTWRMDTGRLDMQMPEIIKKMRRLYCHMVRDTSYNSEDQNLKIRALGGSSGNITIQDDLVINDEQIRVSTSVRGYHVQFVISVEAGEFWRGSMESLGASYKIKKLK